MVSSPNLGNPTFVLLSVNFTISFPNRVSLHSSSSSSSSYVVASKGHHVRALRDPTQLRGKKERIYPKLANQYALFDDEVNYF
jgi:hypothetical protein